MLQVLILLNKKKISWSSLKKNFKITPKSSASVPKRCQGPWKEKNKI